MGGQLHSHYTHAIVMLYAFRSRLQPPSAGERPDVGMGSTVPADYPDVSKHAEHIERAFIVQNISYRRRAIRLV